MDLTSITAAISGLKAATDIAKNINELDKSVEINNKVIELQSVILALQSSLLDVQKESAMLIQENDRLEKELEGAQQKSNLKDQYNLIEVEEGQFVYASISDGQGQSTHWLCCNCFEKGDKSILQMYNKNEYGRYYQCPNCKHQMSLK